jgi:cytoskeletal protein CcmA (bactofilin family)
MREERGQIPGDFTVAEPFTLWGSVGGSVTVIEGGKVYVRGAIYGQLIVEKGGRVHVLGVVSGDVTAHEGAKVIISGQVGGNAINLGGRLHINEKAVVHGRVKTKEGKTEDKRPA